jgi:hypothetical protein
MNAREKRRFVNELIGSVRTTILKRVAAMPEEWDGHELRRYIADQFLIQTTPLDRRREHAYRNTIAVNGEL